MVRPKLLGRVGVFAYFVANVLDAAEDGKDLAVRTLLCEIRLSRLDRSAQVDTFFLADFDPTETTEKLADYC